MTPFRKVVIGPVSLGGMLGRIVELPDGSGRTETWSFGTWVPGGADAAEIMAAPPASAEKLARFGLNEDGEPPLPQPHA